MATANSFGGGRRGARSLWLMGGLLAAGLAAWLWGDAARERAVAAAAYGARTACSCRYIGGRDLESCARDFVPGMEAVFLSEDEEARAVTATVPLVASDTARFRQGYGCVLDPWEG